MIKDSEFPNTNKTLASNSVMSAPISKGSKGRGSFCSAGSSGSLGNGAFHRDSSSSVASGGTRKSSRSAKSSRSVTDIFAADSKRESDQKNGNDLLTTGDDSNEIPKLASAVNGKSESSQAEVVGAIPPERRKQILSSSYPLIELVSVYFIYLIVLVCIKDFMVSVVFRHQRIV